MLRHLWYSPGGLRDSELLSKEINEALIKKGFVYRSEGRNYLSYRLALVLPLDKGNPF